MALLTGLGLAIPAMNAAVRKGAELMKEAGMASVAVVNGGHSGRLGAFAEMGANLGAFTIILGGGSHDGWKQVVPHGGTKGKLPTNPYAFGIPADDSGPVVMDFATGATAGGLIVAAKDCGATLPPGLIIDKEGNPTTDPDKYVDGGFILPAGGPKGAGMGLIAELVGFSLLGPFTQPVRGLGLHQMVIMIDIKRFWHNEEHFLAASKEVLNHIRADNPPADGFESVEIPGQREQAHAAKLSKEGVPIPTKTWERLSALFEGKDIKPQQETNDGYIYNEHANNQPSNVPWRS
eukprot:gnl/MRDRNA2_/MRDRNA2_215420_c0_seq1.p1 gnl/MRDRNA2_/MRDRNA2_215420_c0~~gnl/MRDRNA2_/MRDRNA2_215420_c0_seq1.p1  ORF type:complete len:292 (+),score=61.77 gnl/MRDRNA2_/MRDRNA2_215420_c0_seq1:19-894(+)